MWLIVDKDTAINSPVQSLLLETCGLLIVENLWLIVDRRDNAIEDPVQFFTTV